MHWHFSLISIILYSAYFCLMLKNAFTHANKPQYHTPKSILLLFFSAIVFHALSVNYVLFSHGHLQLDFYKIASLMFLTISSLSLLALMRKMAIENLIIFLIPFCIVSIVLSELVKSPITKILADPGAIIHVVISIIAYSMLTLAAGQAFLLGLQEYLLKHHALSGIFKYLPPLKVMDKLLIEMIVFGFVALTLSILSGYLFIDDIFAQHLLHKTILSIAAWLIFFIFIMGHVSFGWRGRLAAQLTLLGFVFLMLGYFGSKFVLEIVLHRI